MPRSPLCALLGIALLVALLAAAPATAAPPPQELCGVCGDEFSTVAPGEGVPLNVEHSTATITLRSDGSGHWHARVRVTGSAAERLAANATLRERVVRETYAHGRTVVDDPRNLATSVENKTLVVDFDVPGVARSGPGGVVYAEFLSRSGTEGAVELDADRIEIRGPNGTVVTSGVDGLETCGGAAVWEREGDETGGLPRSATLAFGPDGVVDALATWATIGLVALSDLGPGLLAVAAVPTLVLGAAVAALLEFDERVPHVDPDRLALVLAGVGLGVSVVSLALASSGRGRSMLAVAFAGGFYGLVAAAPALFDRPSPRRLTVWVALVGLVAPAALAALGVVGIGPVVALVTAGLFLPLGAARLGRRRTLAVLVAALLLTPLALAAVLFGAGGTLSIALSAAALLAVTLLLVALGAPLYVLGRGTAA